MSSELHSKGTTVDWDSNGGTSYSALSRLAGITAPPKTRGAAETTNFSSTDEYREFIQGWKVGGEPTMRFRFHKTQYALLDASFEDGTKIPKWRINLPLLSGETTPTRCVFNAWIMEISEPEVSVEDESVWECEVTLKVVGKPAWTAGS